MSRLVHFLVGFFLILSLQAQILNPVNWNMVSRQVSEQEFVLTFSAKIDKGWYVYSQFIEEGGPIPTSFYYEEGDHFELVGQSEESGANKKEGHDDIFDMHLIKFGEVVTFYQKIKVKDFSMPVVGYLEFMTCDDTRCLAPTEEDFKFELKDNGSFTKKEEKINPVKQPDPKSDEPKISVEVDEPEGTIVSSDSIIKENASVDDKENSSAKFDIRNDPLAECGEPLVAEKSNWGIFILGFLGGLIALLTPCVFPMIPLTVSFFTKGDESKGKGLGSTALYGFFIFLVYIVLSIPFHLIDNLNPDILNELSTNVFLNVSFFVVFLVFAFSFFGYYELTLPSSWTNRSSQAETAGGVLGIFFMALTLSLVSFSCTGPILGTLLAGALTAEGGAIQLTAGMAGFGLALALPFALFAAFPGWIKNLPKSGGWMGSLKMVLGFVELALALKFLSNADLVEHWGLLKIEIFLGLWILIFFVMAIYFMKKSKLIALITFLGVIYLVSGFRYNESTDTFVPLKLLSGLAPPVGYSILHPNDCPQNLNCFKNLEEGIAYAEEVDKPIMLDFTGYACVNCRKMEEHVWPKKEIFGHLKDDIVLISLYVDDRTALPEDEKIKVKKIGGGNRTLRTIGQKWTHFQTEKFQINSQPYYVLMSPDGQVLNHPVTYTPDVAEYASFLKCGIEVFKDSRTN